MQIEKHNQDQALMMEKVVIEGDLSKLTPQERMFYYNQVCKSLNLNPLTQPFAYIRLNGKLTLYAKKDATDQLRNLNKISIIKLETSVIDGVYVVTAHARSKDGQEDVSTGAVSIQGLKGDALANAMLKAETKSKRRVTLSLCGLGLTDESEIDSIPNSKIENIDQQTGELIEDNVKTGEILQRALTHIESIETEDALKNAFLSYAKELKSDKKSMEQLIFAKDLRKSELQIKSDLEENNAGDMYV